jgi:hypothetical protein
VAEETWDYLAESETDDPVWPPVPSILLRADADEVDVDVDSEPGYVAVRLELALAQLLTAMHEGIDTPELRRAAAACAAAEGANSTHER